MNDYQEKLRSLSFSKGKRGTSIKKPVIHDGDGTIGGFHTEHWDDSQDATVRAKTVKFKLGQEG
jgi:hypothetical protein